MAVEEGGPWQGSFALQGGHVMQHMAHMACTLWSMDGMGHPPVHRLDSPALEKENE